MNNISLLSAIFFLVISCSLFLYFRMYRRDANVIAKRLTLPLSDSLLFMFRTTEVLISIAVGVALISTLILLFSAEV